MLTASGADHVFKLVQCCTWIASVASALAPGPPAKGGNEACMGLSCKAFLADHQIMGDYLKNHFGLLLLA